MSKPLARARHLDREFFQANPTRRYYARASLPFEIEEWRAGDHLALPIMLIAAAFPGAWSKTARIPITGDIAAIPNDERFLTMLWGHITTAKASGARILLSPETHRQLLEAAGLDKKVLAS